MVPTGLFYIGLEGIFNIFVFAPHSNSLVCPFPHSHFRLADQENNLLLEQLTGLRSLQVTRINIRDATSHRNYSGPSWLKPLLQSILSATDLQHIKLQLVIDEEDSIIPGDAWAAVDSIFYGDVFPELVRVEINPQSNMYGKPRSQVHDTVTRLFPHLEERKILHVSLDPSVWLNSGIMFL
jgi:hypothetical protein